MKILKEILGIYAFIGGWELISLAPRGSTPSEWALFAWAIFGAAALYFVGLWLIKGETP